MLNALVELIFTFVVGVPGPPENKRRSPWVQALMEVGCGLIFILGSIGIWLLVMALI